MKNNLIHITSSYLYLGILINLLSSCDNSDLSTTNENCFSCGEAEHFLYSYHDTLTILYDSFDTIALFDKNYQRVFSVCSAYDSDTIESYKKVAVSGNVYENCKDDSDSQYNQVPHLQFDNFNIIEHCSPQVDTLKKTYSLEGNWVIFYLEIDNKKVLPPCESQGRRITINEDSVQMSLSYEGCIYNANITEHTLSCISVEVCVLEIINYTEAQRVFSKQISDIIAYGNGSDLEFNIENNFLVLTNKDSHNSIVLYTLDYH